MNFIFSANKPVRDVRSKGEGGTQMHSVKKEIELGKAEILVNKQTEVIKPGNQR